MKFDAKALAALANITNAPESYIQYAVVACYRTHLHTTANFQGFWGSWITQYLQHLMKHPPVNSKRPAASFKYQANKAFQGDKFQMATVEAWVLAAENARGSAMTVFSGRWNDVVIAKVRYTDEPSAKNWRALKAAEQKVLLLTV
jgi:hypothetical protein